MIQALNIFLLLAGPLKPSSSLTSFAATPSPPTFTSTLMHTTTALIILAPFISLSFACAPLPTRRKSDCNRVVVLRRVRPAGMSLICEDHARHFDHRHLRRRLQKRETGKKKR